MEITLGIVAVAILVIGAGIARKLVRRRAGGSIASRHDEKVQPTHAAFAVEIPSGAALPNAERTFLLGIVGESFDDRQGAIARCSEGEQVALAREPENPHDHLAVSVRRRTGEIIGYLPHGHGLSRPVEQDRVAAAIFRLSGGTRDKPHRGVVLAIGVYPGKPQPRKRRGSAARTAGH